MHAVTKNSQSHLACGSLLLPLPSAAKVHGGSGGTFGSAAPGAAAADAVAPARLKRVGLLGLLAHAIILGGTGSDANALVCPIVAG